MQWWRTTHQTNDSQKALSQGKCAKCIGEIYFLYRFALGGWAMLALTTLQPRQ
jgi:hypothetical protein